MSIHLEYLVGSKEMSAQSPMLSGIDTRMWNIVTRTHPRFRGTFSILGLKELGIVRQDDMSIANLLKGGN